MVDHPEGPLRRLVDERGQHLHLALRQSRENLAPLALQPDADRRQPVAELNLQLALVDAASLGPEPEPNLRALADVQDALRGRHRERLGGEQPEPRRLRADVTHRLDDVPPLLHGRRVETHEIGKVQRGFVAHASHRHDELLPLRRHHQVHGVVSLVARREHHLERHLHARRDLSDPVARPAARAALLLHEPLTLGAPHAPDGEVPVLRILDLDAPRDVVVVSEPQQGLVRAEGFVLVILDGRRERLEKGLIDVHLGDHLVGVVAHVQELDDLRPLSGLLQVIGRVAQILEVLRRGLPRERLRPGPGARPVARCVRLVLDMGRVPQGRGTRGSRAVALLPASRPAAHRACTRRPERLRYSLHLLRGPRLSLPVCELVSRPDGLEGTDGAPRGELAARAGHAPGRGRPLDSRLPRETFSRASERVFEPGGTRATPSRPAIRCAFRARGADGTRRSVRPNGRERES